MILIDKWPKLSVYAYPIRQEVFVGEQGVPEDMELDALDDQAWHAVLFDQNSPAGTGRLVIESKNDQLRGRIGRMAILRTYRGRHFGLQIVDSLISKGKALGVRHFYLHAQISAIPFYEKRGFKAHGEIFDEAGIPHREMVSFLP